MNAVIMCSDSPVVEFNFGTGIYKVLCENLLPFYLRGKIRDTSVRQTPIDMNVSYNAILSWLSGRTLLLSRANAKQLYNIIRVEQLDSPENRARIALMCKAVSVSDNYWVKTDNSTLCWDDVNLRHVSLNDIVTQVALHGKQLTLQGSLTTPEFTTKGAYAKAWRRHSDGNLWLYKLGAKDATESRIEVMCSSLLDKMNVDHVHYKAGEDDGEFVCMCPSMTSDRFSILTGSEFYSYCNVMGYGS
ncbi:MAG: hypothetical protein NC548_11020 [Lachnospiraceae bacterium]|nr:hypothetical protein [Lachnospiraceae bacterium]